jgi:predicted nucleic acid-binding protein
LVIDASVAFKWFVVEDDSEAAISWIGRADLIAPILIHVEVANALWKRVRRGELAGEGASEQVAGLPSLVRSLDEAPVLPRALDIAGELGHPVYDCVYLALAEDQADRLVTADRKFLASLKGTRFEGLVQAL